MRTRLLRTAMRTRILQAATLLALSVCSALALADAPARAGRLALAQGEVTLSAGVGQEASPALVNWPLTSHNQLTTGRDARTEFRVGSTAVRLDGDSALEIVELDDDSLRLHLHYGSASIRIRDAQLLRGFELSTPQGRVRMQEPGRMRVDAERVQDTSVVSVFEGVARVDGGGAALTVRAGKRAELHEDDVRTALALRDSFDDWALLRDRRDERITSTRYVSTDMTGYEELDQYGTWRDNAEYGPLWLPRNVPAGWAPYRDGRWAWVAPWGWTWVDHAPWGYAPFHYGRWVQVNRRWGWAPGRHSAHPVWAPALVGWIGGGGWSLTFGSSGTRRHAPAQGWYPLTPHDTYVPPYRVSQEYLDRINRHAGHDGRPRQDRRHDGVTVVPHEHFRQRGTIVVPRAPKVVVSPSILQAAPAVAAPVPPAPLVLQTGPRERRPDPRDEPRSERDRPRFGRGHQPGQGADMGAPPPAQQPIVISTQPVVPNPPAPVVPAPAPQRERSWQTDERRRWQGEEPRRWQDDEPRRGQYNEPRRLRQAPPQPAPVAVPPAPAAVQSAPIAVPPAPAAVPPMMPAPPPVQMSGQPPVAQPAPHAPPNERFNRPYRIDERRRAPEFEERRVQTQPAPVMQHAPQQAPQHVPQQAPAFHAPPPAAAIARPAPPAQAPAVSAPPSSQAAEANRAAVQEERKRRQEERLERADRR